VAVRSEDSNGAEPIGHDCVMLWHFENGPDADPVSFLFGHTLTGIIDLGQVLCGSPAFAPFSTVPLRVRQEC
jgi:hypothetical protein